RRDTTVFSEQALFNHSSVAVGEEGLPVRVRVANVTPSYFRLMGVPAALGRTFTEEEGEVGRDKEVVLSAGLWQRDFAGDAGALGKELRLNAGFPTTVEVYPEHLVKDVRATLYLLWGGAVFVLVIGGVNVTNLVLVRARSRLKELATRVALGAEARHLARQLVIEGVI